MNDLSILIARLSWPTPSTRWWTMQALSSRLVDCSSRSETESALLKYLSSRKLEAETIEVLCIFWMAVSSQKYSLPPDIVKVVSKPSILSGLIINSSGGEANSETLDVELFPAEFVPPEDFDKIQGSDVPRIFHSTLYNFERHTRLPFLKQMAFEWVKNSETYPENPYQGDHFHFSRPLGDGFIPQCSARAALRTISAYLRTLVVGWKFWGMPRELIEEYSLLALPVNPSLAFLEPRVPDWFPDENLFLDSIFSTECACKYLIEKYKEYSPDDELLAFSSPVVMSENHCVELSLVRWCLVSDGEHSEVDMNEYFDVIEGGSLYAELQVSDLIDIESSYVSPPGELSIEEHGKIFPLANLIGFERLGYLQCDLYPSRLFIPALNTERLEIVPSDGQIEVNAQGKLIATLSYWNVGWSAAKLKGSGGNCGAALVSNGVSYLENIGYGKNEVRNFYFWSVRKFQREFYYQDFSETCESGVFTV